MGECLNDEPQESLFREPGMLPGAIYGADFQCSLVFPGISSKVCWADEEEFCKRMFCDTGNDMCSSKGDPPAEGTKCAENKASFSFI